MLTRIITGVIGIIAAVGIITKGGMLFNAAVAVLAAVAWYEYHKMVENKGYHAYTLTGGVGALLRCWLPVQAIILSWRVFIRWHLL